MLLLPRPSYSLISQTLSISRQTSLRSFSKMAPTGRQRAPPSPSSYPYASQIGGGNTSPTTPTNTPPPSIPTDPNRHLRPLRLRQIDAPEPPAERIPRPLRLLLLAHHPISAPGRAGRPRLPLHDQGDLPEAGRRGCLHRARTVWKQHVWHQQEGRRGYCG